jgi:hypothetical protein
MQEWDRVLMFLYFLLYWHYGPKKRSDFTRLGDGHALDDIIHVKSGLT